MVVIPALILSVIALGGETPSLADRGAVAGPLVEAIGLAAPEPQAASSATTRLAADTPTVRRGAPRVSKVRCMPAVCQTNCPVAQPGGAGEAPGQAASAAAAASAPLARAAHEATPCARAAATASEGG